MLRDKISLLRRRGPILLLAIMLFGYDSSGSKSNTDNPTNGIKANTLSNDAAPVLVLAINAGAYTAAKYQNIEYEKDRFATGGAPNSTNATITGAPKGSLFNTERYGSYTYQIPVTEGTYNIG